MSETETFMILKYGSIAEAFREYICLTEDEKKLIPTDEYEILMEYEYELHPFNSTPFEPK